MNELDIFAGSRALTHRDQRGLRQGQSTAAVCMAQIHVTAQIQALKVDALTQVGMRGQLAAALLTHVEQQVALSEPAASGRVAAISDATTAALVGVVYDTASRLRGY